MPHENHVEVLSLGHPKSPKLAIFTPFLTYQNSPDIRGYSYTPINLMQKG